MPSDHVSSDQHLRIGEFSRRVGVDPDVLRSWERRYALTDPARTAGGLRLYGPEDERRIHRMLHHLQAGLSAAEAARLTRQEFDEPVPPAPHLRPLGVSEAPPGKPALAAPEDLWRALDRFDETEANRTFDRLLGALSLSALIRDVILPYLRALGDRWRDQGEAVIAQEHFATAVLRGRLLGLARGWGGGYGPAALLACFPGDHHDLGLICFGLALRENGWRITFLGANTPLASIEAMASTSRPDLTVLTWAIPGHDDPEAEQALRRIAESTTLALAGHGISERLAHETWANYLPDDPFTAAQKVAQAVESGGFPARGEPGQRSARDDGSANE